MKIKLYTMEELQKKYGNRFYIERDTSGEYCGVASEGSARSLYLSREEYERISGSWLDVTLVRGIQYRVKTEDTGYLYVWKDFVKEVDVFV